jgi:hypothetical protein
MLCSDGPVSQFSLEISHILFLFIGRELKYEIGWGLVLCHLCCLFFSLPTEWVVPRVFCYIHNIGFCDNFFSILGSCE